MEDIAFRLLSVLWQADHVPICRFRQSHGLALTGLFVQVLRSCAEAGLLVLDGTKLRADACRERDGVQALLDAEVGSLWWPT